MIYVLEDIPWGFKYPKVQYWKSHQISIYKGPLLPEALRPYRTNDFSFARWQEDELNGTVMPPEKGNTRFTPKPHQNEASKKIYQSYKNGARGFLEADMTGLGKGLAASTLIPTPTGMKPMEEITVGDFVYDADGKPTRVLEKFRSKASTFYKVTFSNGATLYADGDHRWLTKTHITEPKASKTVHPVLVPESSIEPLKQHLMNAQEKKMAVTAYSMNSYTNNSCDIFIHELLGMIQPVGKVVDSPIYHPQEVLEALNKIQKKNDNTETIKNTKELFETQKNNHEIKSTCAIQGLNKNLNYDSSLFEQLLHSDRIEIGFPEEILRASVEEREIFLNNLLSKISSKNNVCTLRFKNVLIFQKIHELVCSLGYVISEENANDLTFSFVKSNETNHVITHVERIQKTEEYYCISVDSPSHLYLCTDSFIPTHNTLSTLNGITAIAKSEGYGSAKKAKLLVVCPKSVIPQWRQTLHNFPVATAFLRVLIINYQQLNKLLVAPSTARVAKKRKTKNRQTSKSGTPSIDWDYIIFDEAHYLKNFPLSLTSVAASNIAQLNKKYIKGASPFVVYSTATPGASPLNLACMSGFIAPLLSSNNSSANVTPDTWAPFLIKQGFSVKKGKSKYTWASVPYYSKNSEDPKERKAYQLAVRKAQLAQRKDAQRIGRALIKPEAPFIKRSPKDIAGWPEQQIIPFPIQLTKKQEPIYAEAWTRFRNWLRLTPANKDPKAALVENLRYRQKSSLLKVDDMVDTIADFVEAGNQVYISCEFIETIERYQELLGKKGIDSVEISGRNVSEREETRISFQKGEASVVLCTVVVGISLHQEETLPDGTKATSNPRITVLHDVRQRNLDNDQALGRAHRDGKNSIVYIPYLEKTVDEKVIQSYTNKTANMKSMTGSSLNDAEAFDRLFREAAAKTTPPNRLS